MRSKSAAKHRWKFFRISGLDQVVLESGEDLLNLKHLDQKLWVALSCPVHGLEIDEKTLALLDTDHNGRIRVPEVLAAIDWCATRLADVGSLLAPQPQLPLSAIHEKTPEGQALAAAARQILAILGKKDATSISLADTADPQHLFAATPFNGDGVITTDAASDPALKKTIDDIVALYGPEPDRSGKPGVNQAKVDQFFADLASFVQWAEAGTRPEIQILGPETASAFAALQAMRGKIDDYFARCSLATFDARALTALNRQESEYLVVASKDMNLGSAEMAAFPLARVEAGRPLPLTEGINPAWAGALELFRQQAVLPLLGAGQTSLSADQWRSLAKRFAAYETWFTQRPASSVEKLGLGRIQELVTSTARQELGKLIGQDLNLSAHAALIGDVERLVRYYRDLGTLLRNFVNFADFYRPETKAAFQAGTLYLDSRSCDLCVRVEDPAAHTGLASLSKCYIAYCDLRHTSGETMKIAACFTQGDSDYLMVGRNGLFYDRRGRDWDATITRVIDNPISLRQAFWSPYKKFVRFVEAQAAKRAAAAESKGDARLTGIASAAAASPPAAAAEPKKPAEPKRIDVGVVAALGVALGALTTAFGYFLGFFKGMPWWEVPLVFLAVMALISGGSVAVAWLKLRQRTLGPILDANGWAVNGRVKINIPFGTSLTRRAKLPPGSVHLLDDPYKDKAAAGRRVLYVLVLLLLLGGYAAYAYQKQLWPFQSQQTQPQKQPAPENPQKQAG